MQNLSFYQYLKVKNNHSPLLFNSVLWSLMFITLLVVFTKGETPIKVDFCLYFSLPTIFDHSRFSQFLSAHPQIS